MNVRVLWRIHQALSNTDFDEVDAIANFNDIPKACRPSGLSLNEDILKLRNRHIESNVGQLYANQLQTFTTSVNNNEVVSCQICQQLTRATDIHLENGQFLSYNGIDFAEIVNNDDKYSVCRACWRKMAHPNVPRPKMGEVPPGYLVNGCRLPEVPKLLTCKNQFFLVIWFSKSDNIKYL